MGKIIDTKIYRFSGGIADDVRTPITAMSALGNQSITSDSAGFMSHFDCFSLPYKLTPYRSTEADTNDGSTATGMKQYDVYKMTLGSNGKLYGLGKNGSGFPKVVSKAAPGSGNWTLEATAEGNAARITGSFIEWQNAWWFFQGTNQIGKWTIGSTVTNSVSTVGSSILTVAQAIVGADNNLYMFYNNKVVRISPGGSVTDDVCSGLPSDMRITSVARYGTYLAIGMAFGTSATASPTGRSQVFIWDMVTTTTVSDVIDWGEGALMCLGNVEGGILGVSDKYLSSTLGLSHGSMVIRLWSGGVPRVVKEMVSNQSVTLGRFLNEVVVKNNKMYWVASVPFGLSTSTESTFHLGIWVYGRKNDQSDFTLSLDYVEEGIDASNFKINSFGNAGDFWFINHSADGSITKTDDVANYTFTSIYESLIIDLGDSSLQKKLVGVTVNFPPLPTAGVITLKYRINDETAWTTIFTTGVDSSMAHSAVNIEATGATLPTFRELQLRVESTGGACVTGISYACEPVETRMY